MDYYELTTLVIKVSNKTYGLHHIEVHYWNRVWKSWTFFYVPRYSYARFSQANALQYSPSSFRSVICLQYYRVAAACLPTF